MARILLTPSLLAILLLLAGPNGSPAQTGSAGKNQSPVVQWEYAELSWIGNSVRLEIGETVMEAATMPELAEKLGKKITSTHSTAVLNVLGSQGWEMVNFTQTFDSGQRRNYYLFKRQVVQTPPR